MSKEVAQNLTNDLLQAIKALDLMVSRSGNEGINQSGIELCESLIERLQAARKQVLDAIQNDLGRGTTLENATLLVIDDLITRIQQSLRTLIALREIEQDDSMVTQSELLTAMQSLFTLHKDDEIYISQIPLNLLQRFFYESNLHSDLGEINRMRVVQGLDNAISMQRVQEYITGQNYYSGAFRGLGTYQKDILIEAMKEVLVTRAKMRSESVEST